MDKDPAGQDAGWFIGQRVEVIDGPFTGYPGKVYFIDP
jgi:transcription antitermination factor NusG